MNYDYQQTRFSKGIFVGLFVGITATLACLVYDFIFRLNTGYPLCTFVNVATIIFASLSFLSVVGLVYHWLSIVRGGVVVFILLFLSLTVLGLFKTRDIQRSDNDLINIQFRWLLSGIIIIYGICSFFLIPYLHKSKSFEKHVL